MAEQFVNNGIDQLLASITSTSTSFTVVLGNLPAAAPFRVTIDGEIVYVTVKTGLTCSGLTRGFESTVATAHDAGAVVTCGLTAGSLIQAILDYGP